MTPFQIYIILQMDQITGAAAILSTISGVVALIALISYAIAKAENSDEEALTVIVKFLRTGILVFVPFFAFATFAPSTKTLAAAYLIPEITESKVVKEDLPEIYDLAIGKLKEQLEK